MRALFLVLLTGCAADPVIEYVDRPVEVKVPVVMPCQAVMPAVVRYATEGLKADDSDFDKIKALLVERRQRETTENELRALLGACIDG